jgi:hypothetical protein
MGWTLEYIESLPMCRLIEYLQIQDGKMKAHESLMNRKGK